MVGHSDVCYHVRSLVMYIVHTDNYHFRASNKLLDVSWMFSWFIISYIHPVKFIHVDLEI